MSLDPLCNEAKLKRLRPRIAGVSRAEELMLQSEKKHKYTNTNTQTTNTNTQTTNTNTNLVGQKN